MTDLPHIPATELTPEQSEVRRELEDLGFDVAQFSRELRVMTLPNCAIERLDRAGRVRELKEYL